MAKPSQKKQKSNSNGNNNNNNNNKNNNNNDHEVDKISSITKGKRTRRRVPRDSPSQRSSMYRGVTRHRWTGRYEAHLWDKSCWNDSQKKKGRQVYLGAYDDEAAAAHAYDLAALKYWGKETILNFPLSTYENEMKEMEGLTREEYIGSLRRKSSGFSRGVSKYRGVARHHHNGRWEARIGRVFGNKYLYLGTYATQEEAATAYDIAAIEYRGLNAVTNFDLSRYIQWLKPNGSCLDQPSPDCVEPTKSFDSSATTSTSTSNVTLEHKFEEIHDQIEHAISLDEAMWGGDELPSADCSSPLLHLDGYSFLQCSSTDDQLNLCTSAEGQGSSCNDIGNNDEDFFSDLSSFLCDFDVLEDTQMDLQKSSNIDETIGKG